jgi:uncharacterized membrane protein YhaH (DUF805 family)
MEFFEKWWLSVLKNHYADFEGRARRQTYWMFVLVNAIISVVISIVGLLLPGALGTVLSSIFSLAILVPAIAVGVRRLHDIGKSGWWYLIIFIPLIGTIWLIVLLATDSQPGVNEYGENPKGM